ncbi:Outer membrane protein assembly factor BamB [Candidatus Anstonella stagnisolia]|nr:Outer membrane protein assembly factor BamB [Candidatus Anstonella stagnisolia]
MKKLAILALFLLCSTLFAGVKWTYSAGAPLAYSPASDSNGIYFSSDDGKAHALSNSGRLLWSHIFPSKVTTNAALISDKAFFGTSDLYLDALSAANGKLLWQSKLNATPTSIATTPNLLFITSGGSLSALEPSNGSLVWSVQLGAHCSTAGVSNSYVFAACDDFLHALSLSNGRRAWSAKTGAIWNSVPQVSAGVLYAGSTDGKLYALDENTGLTRWTSQANGWISSTPRIGSNAIYFGSNDGYVYSIDSSNGNPRWKYKTGEAVWSYPALIASGSTQLLLAGSNDAKLYVFDAKSGDLKFTYAASDWVTSVLALGNNAIIFSRDGKVVSLSVSPACSIESPQPGSLIGDAELQISGKSFSSAPSSLSTYVRVNNGVWMEAGPGTKWSIPYDPSSLAYGGVKIECSATDSTMQDRSSSIFEITAVKSPNAPGAILKISAPQSAKAGDKFQVSVTDSSNKPLSNVIILFEGRNITANSPFTLSPSSSGSLQIAATKKGYATAYATVSVQGNEIYFYAIGLVLIAAAFFYFKGRKKEQAPAVPAKAI